MREEKNNERDSYQKINVVLCHSLLHLGWVVRKPVNAKSGLKVNRIINFLRLKMFFTAYGLGTLRFFKLKTEG